jgi:hypothetical protein
VISNVGNKRVIYAITSEQSFPRILSSKTDYVIEYFLRLSTNALTIAYFISPEPTKAFPLKIIAPGKSSLKLKVPKTSKKVANEKKYYALKENERQLAQNVTGAEPHFFL